MAYGRDYDIDDPAAGYTLRLRAWEGTLARVCVNGRKAGIIAWQPYAFDLTPYLRKGRNRVEVQVVGSLKNLFGPHYSADKGIGRPVALEQRAQTAARQRLRPAGLRPAGRFRNRHDKITDHKP